jgi:hypothetical protein
MESSLRIEIENFNGLNFELWKLKIEDLLVDREQWETVYPGTLGLSHMLLSRHYGSGFVKARARFLSAELLNP